MIDGHLGEVCRSNRLPVDPGIVFAETRRQLQRPDRQVAELPLLHVRHS